MECADEGRGRERERESEREKVGEEVVGGGVFGDRERVGAGDLW